jgi:tRNA(Ile)-lysidine synthase
MKPETNRGGDATRGAEKPLLQRIIHTIDRYGMLHPAQRIGVAVSGGADSVCLLHALIELAPRWDLRFHVLHLNHGLRGEESRADAEFVRNLANCLGLPVTIRTADLNAPSDNLEQAARRARLAFFREMIASRVVDRVATGHTRSDQAETVLFRFLRGSGTAGLAGIRPVTPPGIIRPLMDVDRSEVEQFLRNRKIAWRDDSTNTSRRFVRNRIRHELLPQLARDWNPAIAETLAHTADWALEEESWWESEIDRVAHGCLVEQQGAVLARADAIAGLPLAVARRVVRRALQMVKGDLRRIDFHHIAAVIGLAARIGHGRVHLPDVQVVRSFDWLRFSSRNSDDRAYALPVTVPGIFPIPHSEFALSLELIEKREGSKKFDCVYNGEMGLDWPRLSGSLELRNWKPGDQYQPLHGGSQKLKTLFQQARVPIWERRGWPILTDGTAIVWARRFGPAAGVAAGVESNTILRIKEIHPA